MGTALVTAGVKTAAAADNVDKASKRIGVSTDAYQELDYWASQNGISQDTMERAVGRLTQRIGLAGQGNEKYAKGFESLGVSIKDTEGNMRSTEDVLTETIQSLSEIEDEATKSAMASELFGTKLARDLMPALQDGSLSLEEAAKMAHEYGMVMDETAIEAGVKFTDAMDTAKRALGGIVAEIGAEVLPIFNEMLAWVIDNLPAIRETFQTIFGVVKDVLRTVIGVVQDVIGWFNDFRSSNEENFANIASVVQEKMELVWTKIQDIWTAITNFWNEHGAAILENATTVFMGIWETVRHAMGYVQEIIETVIGYIVPFMKEQLSSLTEFWSEHGESIMSAIENAFTIIQNIIDTVMPYIRTLIELTWKVIANVIETTVGVIMGVIQVFAGVLNGDFEGIKAGLTQIWTSLWDGIKRHVSIVLETIKSIISSTLSSIRETVSSILGSIRDTFQRIWDAIVTAVTKSISRVAEAVTSGIQAAYDAVVNFFGKFKEAGANIMSNIAEGITGAISKVTGAVKGVMQKARDLLPFSPPKDKSSPLADIHKNGITEQIAKGIYNGENEIDKAMSSVLSGSAFDVNAHATHSMNNKTLSGNNRMETLMEQLLNKNNVIVLDSGELVGATYPQYDRAGADKTQLVERWGR
jgi:phage-related protein